MMKEKLLSILGMLKLPEELVTQVKDAMDKWPADVAVVKVSTDDKPSIEAKPSTDEVKLTSEQIDKMSEKEAKDALKKEMGCEEKESEAPYTWNKDEQSMRSNTVRPVM
jgi:hypothetical protein